MKEITLTAPSKINIFLEITGRRNDGYHNILSLMAKISLSDLISLREISLNEPPKVEFSDPSVPVDESNTVTRALRLISSRGIKTDGLHVQVTKRIPSGGGLGGASTDAAAVLRYFSKKIAVPGEEIAYRVGGDVPFFVADCSWAWIEGIGEIVTPVKRYPKIFINLIVPPFSISTAWAYSMIDEGESYSPRTPEKKLEITYEDVKNLTFNRFLTVLKHLHRGIKELSDFLSENMPGIPWSMSGSGSTFFVLYESAEMRDRHFSLLEKKLRHCKIIKTETI